ncbi:MAG: WD40/YVTN/BNR-like repeat-containing protein, partial [Gemmatimonadota bacterium]
GDPTELGTFYFGSTGGGVWKTTDGGQYWDNVSDGFFKRASVGGLALCPADPNVLYVGTGESPVRGVKTSHGDGIYKSTDAGKTWTHLGMEATRHISKVLVHPRNPDRVWMGAQGNPWGYNPERGVYRSDDGGRSWDKVLFVNDSSGIVDMSMHPTNPDVIMATSWE